MRRSDWFEQIVGFRELEYDATKAKLRMEGEDLVSLETGSRVRVGRWEMPSVGELRARVQRLQGGGGKSRLSAVRGDVKEIHRTEGSGAMIQAASQFNMLEMVGPGVTPRAGVTRYRGDPTQGPACAISCGGGTIFRNYFAQSSDDQLDGLRDVGEYLAGKLGTSVEQLWDMRNGYCMASEGSLQKINAFLSRASEAEVDHCRSLLRVGIHFGVQVTSRTDKVVLVSQCYSSALPVSYCRAPYELWGPFATLVLEATYEATLLAAVLNETSDKCYLTLVGGGAFGNKNEWISQGIRWGMRAVADCGLDVQIVNYGRVEEYVHAIVKEFAQ